ncbi:MAG: 30S ribosomal protein S16 [Rhodothermales bacterium]|nr:30S ribosomal protein S16 [Rhodothermales bacterium]
MAVALRLMRMGRKKAPLYAIVATDSRSRRDGRFIEDLGRYEPVQEPAVVKINAERVMYWLRQGAQPSDTVRNLLSKEGLMLHLHLVRKGKDESEIAEAVEAFKNKETAAKSKLTKRARAAEALKAEEAAAKEREAAEAKERAAREAAEAKAREEQVAKERAAREAAAAAAAQEAQAAQAEANASQSATDAANTMDAATQAEVGETAEVTLSEGPTMQEAQEIVAEAVAEALEATGAGDVPSAETIASAEELKATEAETLDSTEAGTSEESAPDVAPAIDDATGRDREAMISDVEAPAESVDASEANDLDIEGPDAAKQDEA